MMNRYIITIQYTFRFSISFHKSDVHLRRPFVETLLPFAIEGPPVLDVQVTNDTHPVPQSRVFNTRE
jgi:hypothetical protein